MAATPGGGEIHRICYQDDHRIVTACGVIVCLSRKGSNLRPRSYQDRALPLSYDSVEPGRVERPTSAMPWRRSSRLSYGPGGTCGGASLCLTHSLPLCW